MIAAAFLSGIIVGAAATVWVASWFSDKPKPQANVASAVGMDISGNAAPDPYAPAIRLFKEIERGHG
jgi:hypothetical protein